MLYSACEKLLVENHGGRGTLRSRNSRKWNMLFLVKLNLIFGAGY